MTTVRLRGLLLLTLCGAIPCVWGFAFLHATLSDFKAVYYGSRCLLRGGDPYIVGASLKVYEEEGGTPLAPSDPTFQILNRQAYLPTAFLCVAPLAMLPWGPAHVLWMFLSEASLIFACFLIWDTAVKDAWAASLFLLCFLLANGEILFASGNAAAISIALCVIAVWCFFNGRFIPVGVICLAIGLALKPHDTGLVWLFFLLIGGVHRKHALQTLILAVALAVPAGLWATHNAPNWVHELQSDLAVYDASGGLNNPGPNAYTSRGPAMVIDLQAAISIFRDDPRIYNPVSYLVCGAICLVWIVTTLRARFSFAQAWIALAVVAPLSMLVIYHRPYDAKLLMLTLPGCAFLWARRGRIGWLALLLTTLAIVVTSDIPLAVLLIIDQALHISVAALAGKTLTVIFLRPAPFYLLLLCIFYLWVYLHPALDTEKNSGVLDTPVLEHSSPS